MELCYLMLRGEPGKKVEILAGEAELSLKKRVSEIIADDLTEFLGIANLTYYSIRVDDGIVYFVHASHFEDSYTGFFRKVLETSHDEIYVCDGRGITLYCNKAFEGNYGISSADMVGKTAMYLVEQGYSDVTPVPEVIRTKRQSTMEQKTATGRTLSITATPWFDSNGEIAFIVENCRDKTELEHMQVKLNQKELEAQRYRAEVESIRRMEGEFASGSLNFGVSMERFLHGALRISQTDATVLIQGESGTGKSHLAQFIHRQSLRLENPFISINCSTIAPTLFESELFGYAPGAFTGAGAKGKAGLVELASGGTLFLDEIGEVPLHLQVKLLELIQEKRYLPVGDIKSREADVRIIAATNQNLKKLMEAQKFREDLYYRLKVIELEMPPLRERQEDIDAFLNHFLRQYNREYGFSRQLSAGARLVLNRYRWPGNIRELQNLMHKLVIMTPEDVIQVGDLPPAFLLETGEAVGDIPEGGLAQLMEAYERNIIKQAYRITGSSYKTADALKISQSKASRLIRKYLTVQ